MDFSIASILMLDGITNGAVYALLGLATVLVFAVTPVSYTHLDVYKRQVRTTSAACSRPSAASWPPWKTASVV